MNSIDIIKKIYKPYKYTIKGKSTIINTMNGDYVIKECNPKVKEMLNYLKSRNFYNYPKIVDENRNDIIVYEYINSTNMPLEQKASDMMNVVSNLHNKTTYFKEISQDRFKTIYEDILSNINYYYEYYNNLYKSLFEEVYHSPSHYLFITNYSKILSMLDLCNKLLDEWYELVKDDNTERVSVIHNNLSLDHYIKNNDDYLISWNNAKIDTPVLDLVKLYKNNYLDINFNKIFEKYNNNYPLEDKEKKLFYILVLIPPKIELNKKNEIDSVKEIRYSLDYIFKTEELVRPYYANHEEKQ